MYFEMWRKKYGDIGPNVYDGHNADVKKLIPKDQLLLYDVREGWEPLCEFLEAPVPDEPFPNLNDSQAMRSMYWGMMAYGLFHWASYIGGAAGLAYLAMCPDVAKGVAQRALSRVSSLVKIS